jgi:hypothetical protein
MGMFKDKGRHGGLPQTHNAISAYIASSPR